MYAVKTRYTTNYVTRVREQSLANVLSRLSRTLDRLHGTLYLTISELLRLLTFLNAGFLM